MINETDLRELLIEGKRIDLRAYCGAFQTYSAKTFYFFVERLLQHPKNTSLPSSTLREYILGVIRRNGIIIEKKFNPEGWFGQQWTTGVQGGGWANFRKEYTIILKRSEKSPYKYAIHPEYYDLARRVFSEINEHPEKIGIGNRDNNSTTSSIAAGKLIEPGFDVSTSDTSGADITFGLERLLQRFLRANIEQLESGLTIVDNGKELSTDTGRIDITAKDEQGNLVVIELKVGQAPDDALTQILGYMNSLGQKQNKSVRGILIAGSFSPRLLSAAKMIPNIQLKKCRVKFQFENPG